MLATRSVLIVEDDEVIRDMLRNNRRMIIVLTAPALEAADKVIDDKNACVDSVMLDAGTPDGASKPINNHQHPPQTITPGG